ncbi:hypothetical protein KGY64_03580 [Candidatus Bipolaricaulota bacterium]|nr:hypothetical protein [Candidatus Bipolaricaulota bacterium]
MELKPGEKASGIVRVVKDEGFVVELRNEVKGFATRECEGGVDVSRVKEGSEVKVEVKERGAERIRLSIIKLFSQDKYLKKPDKYLKNISTERRYGSDESEEEKVSDQVKEWFDEVDDKLKEIKKHRKERLDKDFWVP